MSTPIDWTTTHADALRNHWWWRPGWQVGTRFYTWHLTFDGREGLHQLVDHYQSVLSPFGGLDLVPRRWLHVTMQGVGHVADVDDAQVDRIVTAVRERLAQLDRVFVQFHRPIVRPEAIAIPALPSNQITQVRDAIRIALGEVLGATEVPEAAAGYQPHLSLAYSNGQQPAAEIAAALDASPGRPVDLEVTEAALIVQHRDDYMYEWFIRARAPMGHTPGSWTRWWIYAADGSVAV
ncbi:2'-5' RNA ligase family protein [Kribbella sp. NPDC059898]|uniref:2'-5' RNA ligase family protein n=1 Tax=Kribbella sp. NPDC059898 TaxID=3346995 RepID=UPI003666F5CB